MKTVLVGLALVVGVVSVAPAQSVRSRATADVWFNVSPNGTDSGDCIASPCQTIKFGDYRAMNDWDFAGFYPFIKLAPGTYTESLLMAGSPVGAHMLHIIGQMSPDAEQSCSLEQAEQVIVEPPSGKTAFSFQDNAIGVVRCLTIRSPDGTGNAVHCRQTPASDLVHIKFGAMTSGVRADEGCRINLGGTFWLSGDQHAFLASDRGSRIVVGHDVGFIALVPVTVTYFALAYRAAWIDFYGGNSVSGPLTVSKPSIVYRGGCIDLNGFAIPGGVEKHPQPGCVYY